MVTLPRTAAALALAALPLWPAVAGAQTTGEQEPEQERSGEVWVGFGETTGCWLSYGFDRTDTVVSVGIQADVTEPGCEGDMIVQGTAYYTTLDNRETFVHAQSSSWSAGARAGQAATVHHADFAAWFEGCQCWWTHTLSSK